MDGDYAAGLVEGSRGRWRLVCGFLQASVSVAIAKGAANCRLGDIHTLEKSVDIRRVEAWLWVRDG